MNNPEVEIPKVIRLLTQSPPSLQQLTIDRYFTPDASFTHPFCRTGSFAFEAKDLGPLRSLSPYANSRWLIGCVYRWYKIMSPRIELEIDSVAFDSNNLILYVSLHQLFSIWLIPFHRAPVKLVTVLQLTRTTTPFHSSSVTTNSDSHGTKYHIASQEDHYQVNEFFKFFSFFRILWLGVIAWQIVATVMCVVGQAVGKPISWWEEARVGRALERREDVVEKVD